MLLGVLAPTSAAPALLSFRKPTPNVAPRWGTTPSLGTGLFLCFTSQTPVLSARVWVSASWVLSLLPCSSGLSGHLVLIIF